MATLTKADAARQLGIARSTPAPPVPVAASETSAPRGELRRRIVALLREHPEGLTPAETRTRLQVEKRLSNTCLAMRRDGLLRRVGHGTYVLA